MKITSLVRVETHTPGPWSVDEENCGGGLNIRAGRRRLAWTSSVRNVDGKPLSEAKRIEEAEAHANAYLIAASPDLLESLRNLVALAERRGRLDEYRAALDVARGVIAKAEAEL